MKKSLSILAAALLSAGAATAAFAQDAPAGQSGNTGSGMETVKERAGNAIDKVKEVAGDVAAAARRGLHAAGQKIEQATSAAKSKSAAAGDETKNKSGDPVTKQPAPEAAADAAANGATAADATLVRTGPSLQERTGDAKDKAGNAWK